MRSLAVNALALTAAIVAVLTPAHAVTVGEITVESALGQPLSARIPVALQPGESMGTNCVSVPIAGRADLSQVPNALVMAPEATGAGIYDLRVTTTQALYEPMYELQLQVRCPGTALVVRQYVLMLDLPGAIRPATAPLVVMATPTAATAIQNTVTDSAAATPPASRPPVRPRRHAALGPPIENGAQYRVQSGDTLSTIAARVSSHTGKGIWATADQIFAANPQAFINANPDLIKLGSEIVIPTASAAPPVTGAPGASEMTPPAPAPVEAATTATTPAPVETLPASTSAPQAALPQNQPGAAPEQSPADPVIADITPPAVFQDEQAAPAPVATEVAVEEPAAAATRDGSDPGRKGAPTWLATLVGLLIGATASLVLLRDRLLVALRGLLPARKSAIAPLATVAATSDAGRDAAPARQFTKPLVAREPSMVVVEEQLHEAADDMGAYVEPTGEAPAQAMPPRNQGNPALDSDLSRLFGDEAASGLPEDVDADSLRGMADLDLDLSAATPDGPMDEDIGWIGDDTALTPTQDMPRGAAMEGETVEHIDLQTLAQHAPDSTEVSQTLRDALNLLESDYEEELTASQVVDRKKLNEMIENGDGENDTLVRTGTDQFPRR